MSEPGAKCATSCTTRNHMSLGECLKSQHIGVAWGIQATKKWNSDLDAYAAARRQGIQPANTSRQAVDDAVILSNESGRAFDADL